MPTPRQTRYAENQPVYLPSLAYCREIVSVWSREKLQDRRDYYEAQATGQPCIQGYYQDMIRAIDDELLGRDLDALEDPFFEDSVRDYEPGDLIDFGC